MGLIMMLEDDVLKSNIADSIFVRKMKRFIESCLVFRERTPKVG